LGESFDASSHVTSWFDLGCYLEALDLFALLGGLGAHNFDQPAMLEFPVVACMETVTLMSDGPDTAILF
jgi:hypothetical protein